MNHNAKAPDTPDKEGSSNASRWRRRLKFAVFALAIAAMAITLINAIRLRKASDEQLAEILKRAEDVNKMLQAQQNYQNVKRTAELASLKAVGSSRVVSDIPSFDGPRIISKNHHNRTPFWVPEGNHTLVLRVAWRPSDPKNKRPTASDFDDAPKKEVTLPLIGGAGYQLTFKVGKFATWQLVGNHPDFKSAKGRIVIKNLKYLSGSSSVLDIFSFPNELPASFDLESPSPERQFIVAHKRKGKLGKKEVEVRIDAEIRSEAMPCVNWETAVAMFRRGQQNRLTSGNQYGQFYLSEQQARP